MANRTEVAKSSQNLHCRPNLQAQPPIAGHGWSTQRRKRTRACFGFLLEGRPSLAMRLGAAQSRQRASLLNQTRNSSHRRKQRMPDKEPIAMCQRRCRIRKYAVRIRASRRRGTPQRRSQRSRIGQRYCFPHAKDCSCAPSPHPIQPSPDAC